MPRVVFFALAVSASITLGCGKSKSVPLDGASNTGDGASCHGEPITWVCTDGGVDAHADMAMDGDASSCAGQTPLDCVVNTGPVIPGAANLCSDQGIPPTCVDGHWTCQGGTDSRFCTCYSPAPQGCACTTHGWSCGDGGLDGRADGASDVSTDASCDLGCSPSSGGSFCAANEQQWECQGSYVAQEFASCRDPATNLQRFCCPRSFAPTCHAG